MEISRFKVITNGVSSRNTKIFFIDRDGVETEISSAIRQVKIDLDVENINQAEIHLCAYCECDIDFEAKGVTVIKQEGENHG